jgi:tRNA pseudouridine38-40 synthase
LNAAACSQEKITRAGTLFSLKQHRKYIAAPLNVCAILSLRMELLNTSEAATSEEEHSSTAPHQTWKLVLAYDGTEFHGWQVQPGLSTVQGELAAAIARVTGEATLPQGSGRTDAGVHALAQVASIALASPIPPPNLQRALNRTLPPAIRVVSAQHAPAGFHARHSAISKQYEYRIYRGEICPPHLARYVYALNWPLDFDAIDRAAPLILGTHDFSSFAAVDPDRTARMASDPDVDNVRTLFESAWRQEGDLLIYTVLGSGFLHHMVRNLVGTFLEVGRGQRRASDLSALLAARERTAAGATAPARGLYLHSVQYAAGGAQDDLARGATLF